MAVLHTRGAILSLLILLFSLGDQCANYYLRKIFLLFAIKQKSALWPQIFKIWQVVRVHWRILRGMLKFSLIKEAGRLTLFDEVFVKSKARRWGKRYHRHMRRMNSGLWSFVTTNQKDLHDRSILTSHFLRNCFCHFRKCNSDGMVRRKTVVKARF